MAGRSRADAARTAQDEAIDRQVGANIRMRRRLLRLSQSDLALQLGLTFQQVQKYEKGVNRVSSSVLWRLAGQLRCKVDQLFEGVALPRPSPESAPLVRSPEEQVGAMLASPSGLDIAAAWLAMKEDERRALLAAARAFARTRPAAA